MKKLTGIEKDQCKFLKDQINFINNNKEDGVKVEDDEIIYNVNNSNINNNYKYLIKNFLLWIKRERFASHWYW